MDTTEELYERMAYEAGVCPDCGESIPAGTVTGDTCLSCGHTFHFPAD